MVGSELPSPETRESPVTDRAVLTVEHVNLDGATGGQPRPGGHLVHDPRRRGPRHRRGRGQRPGRARRGGHGHARAHLRGHHPRRRGHLRLGRPGDPRGRDRLHPRGPAPARAAARRAAVGEPHPRPPDRGAQRRCGRPRSTPARQGRHRADRRGVRRPHAVDRRHRRLAVRRQPAEAHRRPRDERTSPKVLLAAHPTRGVDVGAQAAIWDHIKRARRAGLAVLLISADLEELDRPVRHHQGDPARVAGGRLRPRHGDPRGARRRDDRGERARRRRPSDRAETDRRSGATAGPTSRTAVDRRRSRPRWSPRSTSAADRWHRAVRRRRAAGDRRRVRRDVADPRSSPATRSGRCGHS